MVHLFGLDLRLSPVANNCESGSDPNRGLTCASAALLAVSDAITPAALRKLRRDTFVRVCSAMVDVSFAKGAVHLANLTRWSTSARTILGDSFSSPGDALLNDPSVVRKHASAAVSIERNGAPDGQRCDVGGPRARCRRELS